MRTRSILLAALIVSHLLTSSGWAEVTVSLPTQGYYRPGRFVPVRISINGRAGAIQLRATGAVTTVLEPVRERETVVPWLAVTSSVRDSRWVSEDGAAHPLQIDLHPLADQDALVGIAGSDVEIARSLFPKKSIVLVSLDRSGPLLQPAQAWESLDAVILGAAAEAQLGDDQIQTLLSAGTVLVVHSASPPDARWPWKRSGENWILRQDLAGPSSAVNPDVYAPTYSWDRGWPASFRREIVVAAGLFCILALAVSLWRSRYAVLAFVTLCLATTGLIAWRHSRQSPIQLLRVGVVISEPAAIQYDLWSWRSTVRETDVTCSATGLARPMFAAAGQLEQLDLRLLCRPDGQPDRFAFHLRQDQSLATLTRLVRPQAQLGALQPPDPQWQRFVQELYLRPGDKIAGQTLVQDPSTGDPVSTIVVDRQ